MFGDRIYLTCYTGYFVPGRSRRQPRRTQAASDRHRPQRRRDRLGQRRRRPSCPKKNAIRDHGYAANTPAADAERVYAFFGKSGVFAFDHDGKQLWQADVGSKTHGWGTVGVARAVQGPGAHQRQRRKRIARRARPPHRRRRSGGPAVSAKPWNTPLVVTADSGRKELIVATQGKVLAFDPDTGEPLWSCNTDIGWYMVPSVVAGRRRRLLPGRPVGRRGACRARRRQRRRDRDASAVDQHERLQRLLAGLSRRPSLLDARQRGIAFCAKADTGEIVYEERLDREPNRSMPRRCWPTAGSII